MGRNVVEFVLFFLFLMMMMMSSKVVGAAGRLSFDYYKESCPGVEDIVRGGVQSMSLVDPTTPAAMLRLMFHDCQVQGCDASILLDPENHGARTEMDSIKNFGVRKREAINQIKDLVEVACPLKVSCSDILVLAAREAVAIAGGPRIMVPLGRKDSGKPSNVGAAEASLPPGDIGVDGMLRVFAKKGMSIEESVAIIGAHTLGVTHCLNLHNKNQISSSASSSSGGPDDDPVATMKARNFICSLPLVGSMLQNVSFVFNDPTTTIFDNSYYANAMSGNGVLNIDAEMPLDPRTGPFVKGFAADQGRFFKAFSSAFVKLSSSSVLVGSQGVVRKSCNKLH